MTGRAEMKVKVDQTAYQVLQFASRGGLNVDEMDEMSVLRFAQRVRGAHEKQ